ncbi:MAG: glycosyltransferase family 4 protein [Candidatus Cloacimonetes bacterium]|nr:glycosyltransferase family 4 protein [Candidatus Cloacimonadota bacterium]
MAQVSPMKEIRVLHVDTERGWRGGQQQAFYLHEGLCRLGIKSDLVCRRGSEMQHRLRREHLPVKPLPFRGELDPLAAFLLARYARAKRFNILHLHSAHALGWGIMAKLFVPSLKIVAARRVDFALSKNFLSRLKYRGRFTNAVVAISDNIRNVLLKDGVTPDKIRLIHSGVDVTRFDKDQVSPGFRAHWQIPEDSVLIGTIAAFVFHKDYPNLIQAAAIALAKNPKLHFMAVGTGERLQAMQDLAQELGISEKICFAGSQKSVGGFLKAFDIFVLASKKEGLGTSVLDAMSVGLPVIGTRAGGIPEMIEHGISGMLVEKRNPDALAEAILTLAEDASLRQKLGEAALKRVQQFSKEQMTQRNLDLYKELL